MRYATRLLITAATYFCSALLAFEFAMATQSMAVIWPAAGISFALAWLWGPGIIPGMLVADFAATALYTAPATAALFACGNALALLLALAIMRRSGAEREFYLRPRGMFVFIGATLALSSVSSAIGTGVELALGGLPRDQTLRIWWTWLIGDFTGVLFLMPLTVAWVARGMAGLQKEVFQPLVILLGILATAWLFLSRASFLAEGYPVPFLLMPFLVWASFTMGHRELYSFLLGLAVLAVHTTNAGSGLFSIFGPTQSLLLLQSYLVLCALTTLTLHTATSSRARSYAAMLRNRDALIFSLAVLAELRDTETGEHLTRTQQYVSLLAEELAGHPDYARVLDAQTAELIVKTAPLHDIGKVGVPDAILHKAETLTPEEFAEIRKHPENGGAILRRIRQFLGGSRLLEIAGDLVLAHHEKWDGSGYPQGLRGEAIPAAARLMALADVYDALTSHRVYRRAMPHIQARAIIMEGSGSHFDSRVVEAFVAREEDFHAISRAHAQTETAPGN